MDATRSRLVDEVSFLMQSNWPRYGSVSDAAASARVHFHPTSDLELSPLAFSGNLEGTKTAVLNYRQHAPIPSLPNHRAATLNA